MIEATRSKVTDWVAVARERTRSAQPLEALDALAAARALDASSAAVAAELAELLRRHGARLAEALRAEVGSGSLGPIAGRLQDLRSRLPELATDPRLGAVWERLRGESAAVVTEALRRGDFELAGSLLAQVDRGDPARAVLVRQVELLRRGKVAAEAGDLLGAAECYRSIATEVGGPELARMEAEMRKSHLAAETRIDEVRRFAREGRIADARRLCLSILADHPGHRAALAELEVLDVGSTEREKRMKEARDCLRDGRLQQAASLLVALAVSGSEGDEARRLLGEIDTRRAAVLAGVRQVIARMHDRMSGGREGLLACEGRLAELEKLQCDDSELARVRQAITAEVAGLGIIEAARVALERGDARQLEQGLVELESIRGTLLTPDRLDARATELIDDVVLVAERSLGAGLVQRATTLLAVLAPWQARLAGLERRHGELTERIAAARSAALQEVARARTTQDEGDPSAGESAIEAARRLATDDPEVARAISTFEQARAELDALDAVRRHADRRDFDAARQGLDRLGPTPALLRTKVFDLKQAIARAQGLDGAFLLRVDEGGEFLVVRGESLSIGNLRERSTDLPMLANLAGRHARLRRTMSFHGGQQDKIVSEGGVVRFDGREVKELVLRGRTRFGLGPNVDIEYRLPSERSLSALLTVLGGFQVAGTDRVIWMKDRGRDGRILIGPARDSHVVVPGADSEVEVYSDRDGRIRVRVPTAGELDGRPIHGEHPASAGVTIRCGSVSFVMLPWHRG
ncbi:MAG: hypothetical protein U1F36_06500 [Planctomycetota bacterium]